MDTPIHYASPEATPRRRGKRFVLLVGLSASAIHLAACFLLFCLYCTRSSQKPEPPPMVGAFIFLLPISYSLYISGAAELLPWQMVWVIAFAQPVIWGFGLALLLQHWRMRRRL